jgi:hypothetical protein
VPRIVEITIVMSAISRLATSESRSDSDSKNVSYQRRLKPSKFCNERPELNENRTTTAIGANRNRKKTPRKNLRKRGRSKAFGGFRGASRASAAAGVPAAAVGLDSTVLTPSPISSRARLRAGRAA